MDWDNLRFFLALAESGSLSRASDKLRVDHSTVARRIGMLEQDLGVRLVERLPRSYRLTAEGELIRNQAKKIEACIGDIASFASSVDHSPSRIVRQRAAGISLAISRSTPAATPEPATRPAHRTHGRDAPDQSQPGRGRSGNQDN